MEEKQSKPENPEQKSEVKTSSLPRQVKLKAQRQLNKMGYSQQVLLEASKYNNQDYTNAVFRMFYKYNLTKVCNPDPLQNTCPPQWIGAWKW